MKQLVTKLIDGTISVIDAPPPVVMPGSILVRNHYSLISIGTEVSTIKAAKKGLIGKAKERPQQVKQVFEMLKTQGIVQTYRTVMKKLDAYSPMGYSCAGEVIEVAPNVERFTVGDLVACGGTTACHAEIVCVPVNLCVKLQPDSDLKQSAYNTLGAIAIQGIRQADLRIGETCAIIGLGLLGQLTGLILKASGIKVVGIDINEDIVRIASEHCTDLSLLRDSSGIEEKILDFTNGLGCDAVIICAATDSLDPINFAGAIARKKGTVVIVGNVPTGFDREPHYYKKELQLKMSCSYGPGRYDPTYEEKGIDYPPAYVRWTENRNMQAFQDLVYNKKIDLTYLTTHIFKIDDAPSAYEMILNRSEPVIGVLIEYDRKGAEEIDRKIVIKPLTSFIKEPLVSIGFIGAGSFAQSNLLPNIPKSEKIILKGVMTASGTGSRTVSDRFGFGFSTSDEKDIFENKEINTVFIATRHDSHAQYVIKSLKAGKHVFVEKPLCIREEELREIVSIYNSLINSEKKPILMVGYNRRFSTLTEILKKKTGHGKMAMIYRINAGPIPHDSWIQDPEVGGGRIIGEVCHFVDYLTFLNGSIPISVYASAMNDPYDHNDTLSISLSYKNGSIGTILYFSNGDKYFEKERIEVYWNGNVGVIEDFKELTIYEGRKKIKKKLFVQDKGHKNEVQSFIENILKGGQELIPVEELFNTSLVTFKIIESLRTNRVVSINPKY